MRMSASALRHDTRAQSSDLFNIVSEFVVLPRLYKNHSECEIPVKLFRADRRVSNMVLSREWSWYILE